MNSGLNRRLVRVLSVSFSYSCAYNTYFSIHHYLTSYPLVCQPLHDYAHQLLSHNTQSNRQMSTSEGVARQTEMCMLSAMHVPSIYYPQTDDSVRGCVDICPLNAWIDRRQLSQAYSNACIQVCCRWTSHTHRGSLSSDLCLLSHYFRQISLCKLTTHGLRAIIRLAKVCSLREKCGKWRQKRR